MEYLPGGDLFKHLKQFGRFSEDMAKFFISEVISALEYLHENSIVYRDLKPENLLMDTEGHLRLVDFGIQLVDYFIVTL